MSTPNEMSLESGFLVINQSEPNYLPLLNSKSTAHRQIFIRFSLINSRLFARKFLAGGGSKTPTTTAGQLIGHVDLQSVVYLIRHLEIGADLKKALLEFLVDFFSSSIRFTENTSDILRDYMRALSTALVSELGLKLDGRFNVNLFKLLAVIFDLVHQDESEHSDPVFGKSIVAIHSHLQTLTMNDSAERNSFLEQTICVLKFAEDLLKTRSTSLHKFVLGLLAAEDCSQLMRIVRLVQLPVSPPTESDHEDELLAEIRDAAFLIFQQLFETISSEQNSTIREEIECIQKAVFTADFIRSVEEMCLVETEAFSRRELVQFLAKYSLYTFKTFLDDVAASSAHSLKVIYFL